MRVMGNVISSCNLLIGVWWGNQVRSQRLITLSVFRLQPVWGLRAHGHHSLSGWGLVSVKQLLPRNWNHLIPHIQRQMANTPGHFYIQKVMAVICRKVIQIIASFFFFFSIASFDWAHYVANTFWAYFLREEATSHHTDHMRSSKCGQEAEQEGEIILFFTMNNFKCHSHLKMFDKNSKL